MTTPNSIQKAGPAQLTDTRQSIRSSSHMHTNTKQPLRHTYTTALHCATHLIPPHLTLSHPTPHHTTPHHTHFVTTQRCTLQCRRTKHHITLQHDSSPLRSAVPTNAQHSRCAHVQRSGTPTKESQNPSGGRSSGPPMSCAPPRRPCTPGMHTWHTSTNTQSVGPRWIPVHVLMHQGLTCPLAPALPVER